jgi:hypothetical protein
MYVMTDLPVTTLEIILISDLSGFQRVLMGFFLEIKTKMIVRADG